jgi:hypothetical protein
MMGNQVQNPLLQRLMQFSNNFHGDARQQVQQMLNSGKISQQDYDRAYQMAGQIQKMFGR